MAEDPLLPFVEALARAADQRKGTRDCRVPRHRSQT